MTLVVLLVSSEPPPNTHTLFQPVLKHAPLSGALIKRAPIVRSQPKNGTHCPVLSLNLPLQTSTYCPVYPYAAASPTYCPVYPYAAASGNNVVHGQLLSWERGIFQRWGSVLYFLVTMVTLFIQYINQYQCKKPS